MTKIQDDNFSTPDEINGHPCITASRYLNTVPEKVTITQICQDANNPSLVIINFTLVGAFEFTPTLNILSVDGDDTYTSSAVKGIFAFGHYKNPSIPINTNCSTYHGQIVYDIGSQINNYLSANSITLELVMVGQVPLSYGVSYPNQTCSHIFEWFKGVLPSPIGITYNEGNIQVLFEYNGLTDCSCQIQCFAPSGVTQNLSFCPGEKQIVSLYQNSDSTDPYSVFIKLSDALGNTSNLEFQALINTLPMPPIISKESKPKRVNISIVNQSINFVPMDEEVQYQILKYKGNSANYSVWKDWSDHSWNFFVDYDVIPGETYGYSLRFKGILGDISQISDWSTITI